MGPSEWIAAIAVMITIFSSAIGVAHYFGKKHSEIVVEMTRIRSEMTKVEAAWETRLVESLRHIEKEIANGPRWMIERLDKYDCQLARVVNDATVSLKVAQQHGDEMNQMREMIQDSDSRNEKRHNLILKILERNGGGGD